MHEISATPNIGNDSISLNLKGIFINLWAGVEPSAHIILDPKQAEEVVAKVSQALQEIEIQRGVKV